MKELLQGKRIFIVEDDMLNLAVYSRILATHGAVIYQDVFGYGHSKGIVSHILECLPVDLIILDILLSRGTNGYDVFDELKTDHRLQHIPVVVVSSLDPEIEIPKAQAKGLDGFISKPVRSTEFASQIARIVDGQKVWVVSQ